MSSMSIPQPLPNRLRQKRKKDLQSNENLLDAHAALIPSKKKLVTTPLRSFKKLQVPVASGSGVCNDLKEKAKVIPEIENSFVGKLNTKTTNNRQKEMAERQRLIEFKQATDAAAAKLRNIAKDQLSVLQLSEKLLNIDLCDFLEEAGNPDTVEELLNRIKGGSYVFSCDQPSPVKIMKIGTGELSLSSVNLSNYNLREPITRAITKNQINSLGQSSHNENVNLNIIQKSKPSNNLILHSKSRITNQSQSQNLRVPIETPRILPKRLMKNRKNSSDGSEDGESSLVPRRKLASPLISFKTCPVALGLANIQITKKRKVIKMSKIEVKSALLPRKILTTPLTLFKTRPVASGSGNIQNQISKQTKDTTKTSEIEIVIRLEGEFNTKTVENQQYEREIRQRLLMVKQATDAAAGKLRALIKGHMARVKMPEKVLNMELCDFIKEAGNPNTMEELVNRVLSCNYTFSCDQDSPVKVLVKCTPKPSRSAFSINNTRKQLFPPLKRIVDSYDSEDEEDGRSGPITEVTLEGAFEAVDYLKKFLSNSRTVLTKCKPNH